MKAIILLLACVNALKISESQSEMMVCQIDSYKNETANTNMTKNATALITQNVTANVSKNASNNATANKTKKANQNSGWSTNQPDLYDGQKVLNIDGEKAVKALTSDQMINGHPEFVVAYHPDCPHCHKMAKDFEKLASEVSEKKSGLNLIGVNMSKTMKQLRELKVSQLPTIRLYTAPDKYVEYQGRRNYDAMKAFLAA